jgi:hypothetical protein
MVVDVGLLKLRVDLLALVGQDTHLRKVATTGGGEWSGPCPFCGGRDRFRVQPSLGYWWCRQCGGERWLDAVDYVERRDRVDFREACRRLGASGSELGADPARHNRARAIAHRLGLRRASDVALDTEQPPSAAWQRRAWALLRECEAALWSPAGERVRSYLNSRGLQDATLCRWRIGFHGGWRRASAAEWGLDDAEPLLLARGVVIPWLAKGQLWQLKLRTSRSAGQRYVAVRGGRPWLFGVDSLEAGRPVALIEGELDSLLIDQAAGDLVAVASLGGCRKVPGPRAIARLQASEPLLGVYDNDAAGRAGLARLRESLPELIDTPVSTGKDVTDFAAAGGDIRVWLKHELDQLRRGRRVPFDPAPASTAGKPRGRDGAKPVPTPLPLPAQLRADPNIQTTLRYDHLSESETGKYVEFST